MSSPSNSSHGSDHDRPEFMSTLGLLPPYTLDDVKRAYLVKARTTHPDHGGTITEFRAIQEAYEHAQHYLEFRADKRSWIASQMERYVSLQEVERQLNALGATAERQHKDWLEKSYGDFAELTAALDIITLTDSDNGPRVIEVLVANERGLAGLKALHLPGCQLTDEQIGQLSCFQLLERLDVSRNPVSHGVLILAAAIPSLHSVAIDGTRVGWWSRIRLGRMLRKRRR